MRLVPDAIDWRDSGSVCVINFDGVTYYMPVNVSADFDSVTHADAEAATVAVSKSIAPPGTMTFPQERERVHVICFDGFAKQSVSTASPGHLWLGCSSLFLAAAQCATVRPCAFNTLELAPWPGCGGC